MSRRIILALSCGAIALGGTFVAGCGSDKKKDSGASTSDSAPALTTTTTAAAAGGTITITAQNNKFVPEQITAKVGQKIHWVNNDGYAHNVTATKGETFQSPLNAGGTFDYTVDKAGTIDYVCTIHSGQSGTITVTG
jgi:plastocyanin